MGRRYATWRLRRTLPWMKLRQAYGLLHVRSLRSALQRALREGAHLRGDRRFLPRKDAQGRPARAEDAAVVTGRVIALPARFARDASAFATRNDVAERASEERWAIIACTISAVLVEVLQRLRSGACFPHRADATTD